MTERVIIIGVGNVGGAILAYCKAEGIDAVGLGRAELDQWLHDDSVVINERTTIVIAVKDAELDSVAVKLAGIKKDRLNSVLMLHVNGSRTKSVLDVCEHYGAICAAAHPFQTFNNSNPDALHGIGWGVHCADEVYPRVSQFISTLSGSPFQLKLQNDSDKIIYHAAAVAASNFTYAAFQLARCLASEAGIPAEKFLVPIMHRTLHNAQISIENNQDFDVTGPLVRGDVDAVKKQLAVIPVAQRKQFVNLSLALLEMVRGRISDQAYAELLREVTESA